MNGRLGALEGLADERARLAGAAFGAGFASGAATGLATAFGVVAAGEAAGLALGSGSGARAGAAVGGGTSATGRGFVSGLGFVSERAPAGSGCHGSVAIR